MQVLGVNLDGSADLRAPILSGKIKQLKRYQAIASSRRPGKQSGKPGSILSGKIAQLKRYQAIASSRRLGFKKPLASGKGLIKSGYLDPEMAGINNVPPALRPQFADLVEQYANKELSEGDAITALIQMGMDEEYAEELLYEWQNNFEDNHLPASDYGEGEPWSLPLPRHPVESAKLNRNEKGRYRNSSRHPVKSASGSPGWNMWEGLPEELIPQLQRLAMDADSVAIIRMLTRLGWEYDKAEDWASDVIYEAEDPMGHAYGHNY
jgi:hypothetical protein